MKNVLNGLAFVAALAATGPALADNMCIDTRDIVSSKSTDGKTMVFKMKDGTTLVNHLHGICTDLRFEGFAWNLHSGDTRVCENEQSFKVLQSMETCTLGKFDSPVNKQAMSVPPSH